jgi:signal transduction histidine kinase
VLGNGWTDPIHPEDVVKCFDIYARAFDRREQFQIDFRLRRHDSEYRWVVSTGVPRHHADGSFAGYIGSAMDVTERRLAAEALVTINQRLIDAQEEERSRVARELHDDVAQRLAVLTLSLDTLARSSAAPATDRQQKIAEARDEAMNLAKDVQALSHRLHPAFLEYVGIAAAAAGLCREISKQRDLDITFAADSIPEGLSRPVAVCLYRVLQEALQNAIKHSGGRKIDASLRGSADQIELTVRDFGAGFDVARTPGRGLGLTSMKERVKAVRGRLSIVSEPQRGTTILVSVPVGEGELQTPQAPLGLQLDRTASFLPSAVSLRVLIADDHAEMATAIRRLVESNCDVVETVTDGGAVIEAARRVKPHVILLDLNLPTVDGLQICRQITRTNPEIKVIVMTGVMDEEVKRTVLAMGASAFITKYALADELLSAITQATGHAVI